MIEREQLYPLLGLAILAPDEQTFKDAILTRAHLGGSSSRRAVFASREAALTWLGEQRAVQGVPSPDELQALARHDHTAEFGPVAGGPP